jgi:hypothetical protein
MTTVVDAQIAAKFSRVPLADIANPQKQGPLMVYRDHWWAADDEENGFFFKGKSYSPQCNTNRLIVERHLAQGLATKAVLLPWAYVQFNISDYV